MPPVDTRKSALRFAARYVIAALMIPVGVALGVGGLIQHALRQWRGSRGGANGH
ncbi:MAG: hypothetical protein KJ067_05585 [Vicinamibacteria bacterium]|jgi:hypothetical protein|nr:hypothetical protein [Vicinamibacteria bacterium]